MSLLNLQTNLKDLKFGKDQYKGGSSNEPYIVTKIPATNEPLQTGITNAAPVLLSAGVGAAIGGSILGSSGALIGTTLGLGIGIAGVNATTDQGFRLPSAGTGGPDFLLRGGTLLPNSIVNDEIRLAKYFASTEGILFAVKQNLLSRIGVRTQFSNGLLNEGIYTPISTLLGAAGSSFGLHVNKQGLNPLEGIGDLFIPNRYFSIIKNEINDSNSSGNIDKKNKLVGLYANILVNNTAINNFNFQGISLNDGINVLSYQGGPNAPLGIGKTNIRLATDNVGSPLSTRNTKTFNYNQVGYTSLTYNQLEEISNDVENYRYPKVVDFREKLRSQLQNTLISNSPSYNPGKNKTIEQRTNLGDPGNSSGKNLISYTYGNEEAKSPTLKKNNTTIQYSGLGAASINSYDKINTLLPFLSDTQNLLEDLVNFRIGVLNTSNPSFPLTQIQFRAFLDQISDSYSSDWDPIKYIGRGENFYTYKGFDRKVSLGWTVAAQSKIELINIYTKLNYLASLCSPDYSENGYMRGNIITLTIGGYFYEQPGIITGLNYEMNDENSTWEIGIDDKGNPDNSVNQLPHLIKVRGFNFTPIHQFVPRKQKLNTDTNGDYFGEQRYISLQNKNDNCWSKIQTSVDGVPLSTVEITDTRPEGLDIFPLPPNQIPNPIPDFTPLPR